MTKFGVRRLVAAFISRDLSRRSPRLAKRYLTLIEIMIVMALLSMIASVVGISVFRAVQQQRYLSGVEQLANRLQTAQDIMLIANADVTVVLEQKDGWIDARLDVQQSLEPILEGIVKQAGRIDGIAAFSFADSSTSDLKLNFFSNGSQMSRGELILYSKARGDTAAEKSYVLLPGYPHHIAASSKSQTANLEGDLNSQQRFQNLYPAEVKAAELARKEAKQPKDSPSEAPK